MRRREPRPKAPSAERADYGKPWHLLSDEERARQSATWVYAHSDEDWIRTDLPGRPVAGPIEAGPHEPLPGWLRTVRAPRRRT